MNEDQCPQPVGVFVANGGFGGVIAMSEKDVYENADTIQEAMVAIKKKNSYNEGIWLWTFSKDFCEVMGRKL